MSSGADGYRGLAELASTSPNFALGVMGDLHLSPDSQMQLFNDARQHMRLTLARLQQEGGGEDSCHVGLVQLGDVGGYHHLPGSRASFQRCREWLAGFGLPVALITGNHDLEGLEFETDAQNLAAWQEVFQQKHYWRAEIGSAIVLGLGTSRFRTNEHSAHEVHVDDAQFQWFKGELEGSKGRPVIVCSHAPILGSGLKVVQNVHVKNRCAYLNHSSDPHAFLRLVQSHPNICLWFSGHFHLSHNYVDSISVVGNTAFVTTGVIGKANRDGFRHSRVLTGSAAGYKLYTLDHDTGELRLDMLHSWDDTVGPVPCIPEDELLYDPNIGQLFSQQSSDSLPGMDFEETPAPAVEWFNIGQGAVLAHKDGMVVEYDVATAAPIGVVCLDMGDDHHVVLRDAEGAVLPPLAAENAATLEIRRRGEPGVEGLVRSYPRNSSNTFFQIFQQNKWRIRKAKEALEAVGKT